MKHRPPAGPALIRLTLAAALAAATAQAQEATQPETTHSRSAAAAATARSFMAVAAHPAAAKVGRDVLARGGSAADAATAMQMMLNLVDARRLRKDGVEVALPERRVWTSPVSTRRRPRQDLFHPTTQARGSLGFSLPDWL